MWGAFLSEPLSIVALVGRYPANKLMERIPIGGRQFFSQAVMELPDTIGD